MTSAATALPLASPDMAQGGAALGPAAGPPDARAPGGPQRAQSGGKLSPNAERDSTHADAEVRQSFAATLDTVQSAPAETPAASQVQAPSGAVETQAPPADAPSNPHLAGLAMPMPTPDVVNAGNVGNESPPGGNGLPVNPTSLTQTAGTHAQFAAAGQTAAVPAPGESPTATGADTMLRAVSAPNPPPSDAATRGNLGAAVTSLTQPPPAAERVVDAPRADTLRAGVLESMSTGNGGANLAGEQRDAQTGGRQLPETMVQFIAPDRQVPAPATPTAEFSLNAGPAGAMAAETPLTGSASGAAPGADPLTSGQRPLQPLGDQAQWAQGLGQRLLLMADGEVQTARMRLHPESLGRLEVRIEIEGDAARVWFNANSAAARDAIESALPRLREMFDANGLELLGTDVSGDGPDYHAERDAAIDPYDAITDDPENGVAAAMAADTIQRLASDRLLDVYA